MSRLVLLRHGESLYNRQERWAGWRDVSLTDLGRRQAWEAGRLMADAGLELDMAFASWLERALSTMWLALLGMGRPWVPHAASWRLNERHCGALEGMAKADGLARYGRPAIEAWRDQMDAAPPPLEPNDPRHPRRDPRFAHLADADLPAGESLAQVLKRLGPFWRDDLLPYLQREGRVLVVGHGVCLWGLARLVGGPDMPPFRLPNGNPLLVELDSQQRITGMRYLDPARANPLP